MFGTGSVVLERHFLFLLVLTKYDNSKVFLTIIVL